MTSQGDTFLSVQTHTHTHTQNNTPSHHTHTHTYTHTHTHTHTIHPCVYKRPHLNNKGTGWLKIEASRPMDQQTLRSLEWLCYCQAR